MSERQVKSKARVADHGEVFTAQREVNAMLDLVKQETERIDSRFLEPACGDGNFLAEILRRKLNAVEARYKSFGIGTIASIDGSAINVDFDTVGQKKMGYKFCMKNGILKFLE